VKIPKKDGSVDAWRVLGKVIVNHNRRSLPILLIQFSENYRRGAHCLEVYQDRSLSEIYEFIEASFVSFFCVYLPVITNPDADSRHPKARLDNIASRIIVTKPAVNGEAIFRAD
jgi:hypothetical protein